MTAARHATALALLLLAAPLALALDPITVLTAGKVATFRAGTATRAESGRVAVAGDAALSTLPDPNCPAAPFVLRLAAYPQATNLVEAQPEIELPCAGWKPRGRTFTYTDPTGVSGISRVVLGRDRLVVKWKGGSFVAPRGPLGYVELWLHAGGRRHLVRFHVFRRNDETLVATRKTSAAAADGEAAFWTILHGDDSSPARQEDALAALEKAARKPKDGRAPFLLGMLHLYRFGQMTPDPRAISDAGRAEIDAAVAAFEQALPLLWDADGARGDSRVPGFVAAARYQAGRAHDDPALIARGLDELAAALEHNPLFNVFDYIVVAQAVPPDDPSFQIVIDALDDILGGPGATCIVDQPEICGDAGFAPRNIPGSLTLFGDLYAKAGRLPDAMRWYGIANGLAESGDTPYRFRELIAERIATAAARVALYQDDDPSNDPVLVGAGVETCTTCHYR